jgi:hypothetical protein
VTGRSPYTPDWAGYLLAWLVASGAMAALLTVGVLLDAGLLQALQAAFMCAFYIPPFSIPAALVGIPLVHLACRRVPAQWVHVAVAGLAGFVTGLVTELLLGPLLEGTLTGWLPGEVALSAALGRAAVIRFVPDVQRRRILQTRIVQSERPPDGAPHAAE